MAIRQQDGNIYCLAAILSEICPTESLNSVIRHAIKKRKVFPTDEAGEKSCVAGNPVCVPEMDDAVEGLAYGNEPLYYQVQ